MDAEAVEAFCLGLPGAWLDHPWGDHGVAKIGANGGGTDGATGRPTGGRARGRIFAHFSADGVAVKCGANRDEADVWLERFPGLAHVMPYDGRFGWNTLDLRIPEDELLEAILDSYRYAYQALPRAQRPAGGDEV